MKTEYIHAPASLDGSEGQLAVIVYAGDNPSAALCPPGVQFLTDPSRGQQVALISHPAGHVIPAHRHYETPRTVRHTGEVLLVRRGRVAVDFFTSGGEFVCTRSVRAGDLVVLMAGGHGFTVIEDAELFEVKQGPYPGRDKDKVNL